MCVYIFIYIYMSMCIFIYIHICTYIHKHLYMCPVYRGGFSADLRRKVARGKTTPRTTRSCSPAPGT